MIEELSAITGIPPPPLRLLLSLLWTVPVALIYRLYFLFPNSSSPFIRNIYILVTSLGIAVFFTAFSKDIIHSFITIIGTWFIGAILGDQLSVSRKTCATLIWILNFGYLLISYFYHATDDYDLCWTTPQSVLCLRLISLGMDYLDGKHLSKQSSTSSSSSTSSDKKQKQQQQQLEYTSNNIIKKDEWGQPWCPDSERPLKQFPNLLEVLGYSYFFGAWLAGPQFSFHRYSRFITCDLFKLPPALTTTKENEEKVKVKIPPATSYAIKSYLGGLLYMGLTQVAQMYFPTQYIITPEFASLPLWKRWGIMWLTGKTVLMKYLGVWIFTDGTCTLSGISFSGYHPNGKPNWNGLTNIRIKTYEMAGSLSDIISSFNVNTNHWSKIYIFKRCRGLNSKALSSLVTLLFLATWHGFHIGYYICFALEYVDMIAEGILKSRFACVNAWLYNNNNNNNNNNNTSNGDGNGHTRSSHERTMLKKILGKLWYMLCWFLTTSTLYYACMGFDLLSVKKGWIAYSHLNWIGHWTVFGIIIGNQILNMILPKRKKSVSSSSSSSSSTPAEVKKDL